MIRLLIATALLVTSSQAGTREQSPGDARGLHSIRGSVVDAQSGAPVRRAQVTATRRSGDRVTAVSDAQGRFLVGGVPPGTYTLSVSKPGYLSSSYGQLRPGAPGIPLDVPSEIANGDLKMTIFRGGVIPGRVVDERGEPVPLAQVRALQYQYEHGGRRLSWAAAQGSNPFTDDRGGFRLYGLPPGRYFVVATAGAMSSSMIPVPPPPVVPDIRVPMMTYFPNTTDAANAQPITVTAGKETPAITITLGMGRPVRVRGRVIRSTGEPFEGGVEATPNEGYVVLMRAGGSVRPDGSFELRTMLPGSYQLTARDRISTAVKNQEVGHAIVTVGTDDVDDVLIVTGKPGVARGRIVVDDGTPLPRATQLTVTTVQASGLDRVWRSNGSARVKDDASFELDGLAGGHAFQIGADQQRDWVLSSAWRKDQDITDAGVTFGPNDVVEDITLVVTRARNELSGAVVDGDGRSAPDALVIVFPSDSSLWMWSRWVRAVPVDRRGEFRLDTLPAYDDYLIAAIPHSVIDPGQWRDAELLYALRSRALPVALGATEKKSVNLRLVMQ